MADDIGLPYAPSMVLFHPRVLVERTLTFWRATRGQDMIEYALMAGFVAVAAGAVLPGVSSTISTIFSKVASVMTVAASQS